MTVPVAGDGHIILTKLTPTTGTNNLIITGASSPDTTILGHSGVTAVTGASSSTGTAPVTKGFTVGVLNSWVISSSRRRPGPVASTPGSGVTNDRTSGNAQVGVGDSGPEAISTVNHTWTGGASDMSVAGIVLEPSAVVASTRSTRLMMGI